MERSLPEIHSKLQETLENFLHLDWRQDEAGCSQVGDQLQQVAVKLEEEDIVSMQDLAVACFDPMFWRHYSIHCKQYDQHVVCGNKFLKQTAEDLLCLLKPAEEELLLPPADVRIWEAFAAAKMQHRQFSIVTAFGGYERSLPESNELVQSMQMKFEDLLSSFQEAQLHMDGQGLLSPKLKTQMTAFAKRLNSCCRGVVTSMKDRKDGHLSSVLFPGLGKAKLRWSQLASEAAQIAAEVRELTSDANSEVNSWSLIGNAEAEVGSIASGHSVDSQMSCLSGHGGPHCFLPSYLFKSLQSEGTVSSTSTIWDLQKGTKIMAADGTQVEVVKLEVQKTNRLLELWIDDAMPFTTTPNHRIMVPKEGEDTVTDATKEAAKLDVGQWVICSDRVAKRVIGIRKHVVEEQEVLAITFHPDKAVACFLPPEEPVVLTKGRTQKASRRGGMGSRGSRHDVASIPGTAAGEYEE